MNTAQKKGFTLIELLVVIAIIGILSSVVLASLNSARRKGRDARRVADIKQLQLALELYYDANGTYPSALTTANLITPGYIAVIPNDPSYNGGTACTTGAEAGCYAYDVSSNGSVYYLGANLEDAANSALDTDADTTDSNVSVDGPDADGCDNESGVYCYDVRP